MATAIMLTSIDVGDVLSGVPSITTPPFTPAAGTTVFVTAFATRDFHTDPYSWVMSTSAPLGDGNWFAVYDGPILGSPVDTATQMVARSIPVGDAPPAGITLTVDAGTGVGWYYYAIQVWQLSSSSASIIAQPVVGGDIVNSGGPLTLTLTLPTTTSSLLIGSFFSSFGPGVTSTWNVPVGWTSAGESLSPNGHIGVTSATDPDASVALSFSVPSGLVFSLAGLLFEIGDVFFSADDPNFGVWRFGLDDGTEIAHTWAANEVVHITAPAGTTRLLRVRLDGPGWPTGWRWQYRRIDEGPTEWRDLKL